MTINLFLQVAWLFFIALMAIIIPLVIGQRYGQWYGRKHLDISADSIGSVVSAAFGLLAFMLAFTFQIAANRYDARKELLFEEVKDIRTAYLRSGLIPEPYQSQSKENLTKYVDIRVELVKDQSKLNSALAHSQVILDTLWKYTESLAAIDRSSEVYALYTTAVNDLVDAYNARITMVFVYRIPPVIMWVLSVNVFMSMILLGYQFGVSSKAGFSMNLVLAILFTLVLLLIFALDRPEKGLVQINQKPMLSLQKELQNKRTTIKTNRPQTLVDTIK